MKKIHRRITAMLVLAVMVFTSAFGSNNLKPVKAEEASNTIIHNFTVSDAKSNFFTITGKVVNAKEAEILKYNDHELTKYLKMETGTEIKFTTNAKANLTLVFNSDFVKKQVIDGVKIAAVNGIITVDLEAGEHTIAKNDTAKLYYISLTCEEIDDSEENAGEGTEGNVTEEPETTPAPEVTETPAPEKEMVVVTKVIDFTDVDDVPASINVDGFVLTINNEGAKIAIDKNSAFFGTADNYVNYTKRLKTGGKSSSKNSLALTIPADGKLFIAVRTGSNSAKDRNVVLTQNGTKLVDTVLLESNSVLVTMGENDSKVYSYIEADVKAGTVEITYPVNGINFYSFELQTLEEAEEIPAETPEEQQPEATPEVTPEVTPETTPSPEATPETTPSPEATPEVTPEVTPEATPEVTPAPTEEEIPEIDTPQETPEVPSETEDNNTETENPAIKPGDEEIDIPKNDIPLAQTGDKANAFAILGALAIAACGLFTRRKK